MCGSTMVTIFRPVRERLVCISTGLGKTASSHVKYRFPSVCSMSSHSTSNGKSSASNLPCTAATSSSSL